MRKLNYNCKSKSTIRMLRRQTLTSSVSCMFPSFMSGRWDDTHACDYTIWIQHHADIYQHFLATMALNKEFAPCVRCCVSAPMLLGGSWGLHKNNWMGINQLKCLNNSKDHSVVGGSLVRSRLCECEMCQLTVWLFTLFQLQVQWN